MMARRLSSSMVALLVFHTVSLAGEDSLSQVQVNHQRNAAADTLRARGDRTPVPDADVIQLALFQQRPANQNRRRAAGPALPEGVERIGDVTYAQVGDKSLLLDLYLPRSQRETAELVVWVHGGGWRRGSKDRVPLLWLTGHGYAVASIGYRLSGEAIYPAQIHDCKAAIRWLRAHAQKYGYRADRIGVAGSSAGGHLVALLGTSGGVDDLEGGVGHYPHESSRVQAVCDLFGPTDLLQMDAHALAKAPFEHDAADSPESLLIGGPIQENKDKVALANPITFVDRADPPFLILHGDSDPLVPVHQSRLLHAALEEAGVGSSLHMMPGAGHGGAQFSSAESNELILAFFDRYVKQTTASSAIQASGFVPLFDGETLSGWTVRGGIAAYKVEGGTIVGSTTEGSPNTFLCTNRDYADFELVLDVKCDPRLNSGIQIRSHVYGKDTPQASEPSRVRPAGTVYGYQCEIAEQSRGTAGNFWDEARHTRWHDDISDRPGATQALKDGEWNQYRIVAQGDRIRSWVNGVACADFHDATDATGFIGLQVHGIKPGTGPYQVRWKNVRIRELKAGDRVN